jgi:hypothetical protein
VDSIHSPSIRWSTVPVSLTDRIGDPSGTSTVLAQPLANRSAGSAQESSVDVGFAHRVPLAEPFEQADDDAGCDPFKHCPARPSPR